MPLKLGSSFFAASERASLYFSSGDGLIFSNWLIKDWISFKKGSLDLNLPKPLCINSHWCWIDLGFERNLLSSLMTFLAKLSFIFYIKTSLLLNINYIIILGKLINGN